MLKLTKKFHHTPYPTISPTRPELSTAGKTVLITGGGTGIGYACAKAFAQSGAKNIIITSRTAKTLSSAKDQLSTQYPNTQFHALSTDISDPASVSTTFATIAHSIGPIHICIANAGYAPSTLRPITTLDLPSLHTAISTNLLGTLLTAQHFSLQSPLPSDPIFIHISTGHAHAPPQLPGLSAYAATKAAALKAVEFFAFENPGVRVHTLHPGAVQTGMTARYPDQAQLREDVDLPGQFCVWLASAEAGFLRSRFVWASWDVDEMVARRGEFQRDGGLCRVGLKVTTGSRL